jgi:hypothetical protein
LESSASSKQLSRVESLNLIEGEGLNSNINANETVIYPNPTEGIINIDLSTYLNTALTIDIINSTGQSLIKVLLDKNHKTVETINLDGLVDGIYYVIVDGEIGMESKSIILLKK